MEERPMTDHEAYDEGYDAYWDGVDDVDNPYDQEKEPVKRSSWEEGWREARTHDYDEDD
jgi:ribosome modulation factor